MAKWRPQYNEDIEYWVVTRDGVDALGKYLTVFEAQRAADTLNDKELSDEEQAIMKKVRRMLGYEPVGMLDLLHILAHPDLIQDTKRYIASKEYEEERHHTINRHKCSCGWEGDTITTHLMDLRNTRIRMEAER